MRWALACVLVAGACNRPAPPPAPTAPSPAESADACLDRVLSEAGLNRFGDPLDRMYAGGSPLFDERTGTTTPRRQYVARSHPELVARCPEQ